MTTSNTKVWTFQVDEIIKEACDRIGGEWSSAEEQMSARRSLNLLLTDISNRGYTLGHIKPKTLNVTTSVAQYILGTSVSDVLDVVCRTSGKDVVMDRISFTEYNQINDKTQSGRPTTYATLREKDQVKVFVYPVPTSAQAHTLEYYAFTYPDTVTRSNQDIDVNRRFYPALVYGLAYEMSQKRSGISPDKRQEFNAQYEAHLARAFSEDRERTKIRIVPKFRKG